LAITRVRVSARNPNLTSARFWSSSPSKRYKFRSCQDYHSTKIGTPLLPCRNTAGSALRWFTLRAGLSVRREGLYFALKGTRDWIRKGNNPNWRGIAGANCQAVLEVMD
jgi:hypothetical protein